jgi:hypothetical protein
MDAGWYSQQHEYGRMLINMFRWSEEAIKAQKCSGINGNDKHEHTAGGGPSLMALDSPVSVGDGPGPVGPSCNREFAANHKQINQRIQQLEVGSSIIYIHAVCLKKLDLETTNVPIAPFINQSK